MTPDRVRAGVATVLGDPSYRRRARELAAQYARYDGVALTAAIIEEVARGAE